MKKCGKYDLGKNELVFLKVKFVSNRLNCLVAKIFFSKESRLNKWEYLLLGERKLRKYEWQFNFLS